MKSRNENNTYDIYNGNNINEIHNSSEMSYIDERIDAPYMVEINNRLGGMSYIRRCGYVNDIIGIYHDDGLNTWINLKLWMKLITWMKFKYLTKLDLLLVASMWYTSSFMLLILSI
jgi:hypothetical protein